MSDRNSGSNLAEFLVSAVVGGACVLSLILLPFGFIAAEFVPKFSLSSGIGSASFTVGYLMFSFVLCLGLVYSAYPSIGRRFVGEVQPESPASLREFHLVLLTTCFPAVFVVGGLIMVARISLSFEQGVSLVLWFEFAYIMSFALLRATYGGMFSMKYVGYAFSSAVVAKDLASRSLKQLQERRPFASSRDLQAAYLMTADWLRSMGYECEAIVFLAQRLSTALELDTMPSEGSLRTLAETLQKLPSWSDLVEELRRIYLPDLAWISSIDRISGQRRSLESIQSMLIAVGTVAGVLVALLSPFLSLYGTQFTAAVNTVGRWSLWIVMASAAVLLFAFCYIQWKRALDSIWPGVEVAMKMDDEKRLSKSVRPESMQT